MFYSLRAIIKYIKRKCPTITILDFSKFSYRLNHSSSYDNRNDASFAKICKIFFKNLEVLKFNCEYQI